MNDVEVMNSYGGYSPVYLGGARGDRYGYGYAPAMVGNPTEMSYYRSNYLHEAGSKKSKCHRLVIPPPTTQEITASRSNVRSGRAPLNLWLEEIRPTLK